jgi:hypothetical protein
MAWTLNRSLWDGVQIWEKKPNKKNGKIVLFLGQFVLKIVQKTRRH